MRPAPLWPVAALTLLALCGPASRADWLTFARGGSVELPVRTNGTSLVVAAPGGDRVFPMQAFRAIVPSIGPEMEWQDRLRAVEQHDPSARAWLQLGWWGLERGLTAEAMAAFRAGFVAIGSQRISPLLQAGRTIDRVARSADSPELTRLKGDLGGNGWIELAGRHFLLLHQGHDEAGAAERLDVIDRVVETFYLSLAMQGIELEVPRCRLVSVWFARQEDYVAYLRRAGAGPFANTQGYFHPTARVVFAFDTRSAVEQAQPRRAIERRRRDPDLTGAQRVDLERQLLLLDLDWREVDLGIAAHETVHQLVDASGLAPRGDSLPIWLHEGLAAQFEEVRGGRWAGLGRINHRRMTDWRTARDRPHLASLLRDEGLTHGYRRDRYAEAWALVYFLRKQHPAEFVSYLDRLRLPQPPSDRTPAPDSFAGAFGVDLHSLERDWITFMADQVRLGDQDAAQHTTRIPARP